MRMKDETFAKEMELLAEMDRTWKAMMIGDGSLAEFTRVAHEYQDLLRKKRE